MAGDAGASAELEYQRRRAQDRRRRRDNLARSLVIVLLTPAVVYILITAVAVPLFNRQLDQGLDRLTSTVSEPAGDDETQAVDDDTAHIVGLLLAGAATVSMAMAAWGRRQTTESWGIGAAGERYTAALLDRLARRGYVVLHDRQMPGSRANIDHVVVGPTGLFVIETKNFTGRVVIGRRDVRHNGRSIGAVDQARREADAVAAALGDDALRRLGGRPRPIVCIHGAEVQTRRWWTSPVVNGVLLCSSGRLRSAIKRGKAILSPAEVAALVERLDGALQPAVPRPGSAEGESRPRCLCGASMVKRTRRHDGAAFWGCSRYPSCRQTRPTSSAG